MDSGAEEIVLPVGTRCGCLEIMDDGAKFLEVVDAKIASIEEEKAKFVSLVESNQLLCVSVTNGLDGLYMYTPVSFEINWTKFETSSSCGFVIGVSDFNNAVSELLKKRDVRYYKCKCWKCGKIRYYTYETLQTNPQFCYQPKYRAPYQTGRLRTLYAGRWKQYWEDDGAVRFVFDRGNVIPSDEYCGKWNEKKAKELQKKVEKRAEKEFAVVDMSFVKFAENPVGTTFGCLEVMDDGAEFLEVVDAKVASIGEEKAKFMRLVESGQLKRVGVSWDANGSADIFQHSYAYTSSRFGTRLSDFDRRISGWLESREVRHYKCKCSKCGKIRYYTYETLKTNPEFCYRPMYCSSRHTYSNAANNANYRKRMQYRDNESVRLVDSRSFVSPSEMYCDKWNEKRAKELKKAAEKEAAEVAAIPRVFAANYDKNYVGLRYESLDVVECVNDALESTPCVHYNQQHRKSYGTITVFKQYRCRCYLCGKEQLVTCDKFGIYPPTAYGYRAYNGYWSKVQCDCHPISSFQWIVNKLLLENQVVYRVECYFPDLYGCSGRNPLLFDFAVWNTDGTLKCLIECQGEQHYKPVEEFGGQAAFEKQVKNDNLKREYAAKHNIPLIEISYKDKNIDKVAVILKEYGVIA